ncbi:hypothetical protein KC726_05100 [Candidatus Woesebacteria bacterium]|nr:hypothetical protein [Candidatus Woesebacteria bacterium]
MRKINLFSSLTPDDPETKMFKSITHYGRIFIIVAVVVLSFEFVGMLYVSQQLKKTRKESTVLKEFVDSNLAFTTDLKYFTFKYGLLKNYLAQDANVAYYYQTVSDVFQSIDNQTIITHFTLDANRAFKISVGLPDYETSIHFLESLEDKTVVDHFDSLTITSFETAPAESGGLFVIDLEGTFKAQHGI